MQSQQAEMHSCHTWWPDEQRQLRTPALPMTTYMGPPWLPSAWLGWQNWRNTGQVRS